MTPLGRLNSRIANLGRMFRGMVSMEMWRELIDLLRELDAASDIRVGRGLEMSRGPNGTAISSRLRAGESTGRVVDETDGPVTELGHTHGTRDTDTWTMGGANNARVYAVTDIWYDPVTFKQMFRMRPVEITASGRWKHIAGEDDPGSIVFQAAECQAQPDEAPA